jgi:ORF6N domain
MTQTALAPVDTIDKKILVIRGKQVLLDRDLAALYGVKATALRQQVKRNPSRFPEDFRFQLTKEEALDLVSHFVIPSPHSLGGSLPYAFTQEGLAMLSSVLTSERAIQTNIAIMRVFVRMREILYNNQDLAARVHELEETVDQHGSAIVILAEEIDQIKDPPPDPSKRPIGFLVPEQDDPKLTLVKATKRRPRT